MTIIHWEDSVRLEDNAIVTKYSPRNAEGIPPRTLRISFQRTIRVPDNVNISNLPPDLGDFPLLSVRKYANRLPPEMVCKGGVFLPMHQRESMWICFEADEHFMIKIYAGGVNVVSGEHVTRENSPEAKTRRQKLLAAGKSIQDYVVVPEQRWLDGIAVAPGVVRQFVAMPMGENYSVEAQLTGREVGTSLQFEITPISLLKKEPAVPGCFPIFVRSPHRATMTIYAVSRTSIMTIKQRVETKTGIPPNQQVLSFMNIQLEDWRTLNDYSITKHSDLTMAIRVRGGSTVPNMRMAIAAGGRIEQKIREVEVDVDTNMAGLNNNNGRWAKAVHTIAVHALNSAGFRRVTGRDPPACPIGAAEYAAAGLPFFRMFGEGDTTVAGAFDAVRSVGRIDRDRGGAGGKGGGEEEASVYPRLVELDARGSSNISALNLATLSIDDPDSLLNPDGPLMPLRTVQDLVEQVQSDSDATAASTRSSVTVK